MLRAAPQVLFDSSNATTSLSGVMWPGTLTATLPAIGSGGIANVLSGTNVVGGVFAPTYSTANYLLDFCAVGGAEANLVLEVGKLDSATGLSQVLGAVTLTSSTQTIANLNPFTGDTIAATTLRLFDTVSISLKAAAGDIVANIGGAADDTPCQLIMKTDDGQYFYVLVTNLNTLTRAICVGTAK